MALKQIIRFLFSLATMLSPLFISIHGVVIYFLVLWIALAVLYASFYNVFSSQFFTWTWLILPVFYLIHGIAMIYTSNMHSGWFDLEVKLSLFIVPVVFYIQHKSFNLLNVKTMKWLYLVSITMVGLCLFILAIIKTTQTHEIHLYYLDFSAPYHPTYLAMYVLMGLVFLLDFFASEKNILLATLLFLWVLLLLGFIYFLSSKAGILSTSIVFVLASFHYIFRNKLWVKPVLLLFVMTVFTYVGISENIRFKAVESTVKTASTDVATSESNAVRWLVWHAGVDLVKQHWLCGVGTGDIKDVLMQEYAKRNMQGAFKEKLNAHNQYLETFLAQGLLGILWLVFIFVFALKKALKKKNIPWLLFLVLVGFNFLFESMLNTQAGVVFFAYFYSFFIFEHKLKNI
jgi:O-antigen ligase